MFAQYSPLFTSGLLSESNTPSTSRRPSLEMRPKDPRESLPVDASIDSIYESSTSTPESDALFLTIMPSRRRAQAGNSFLSLDLAESQSMRSMSLRRKDTITTRATTHFGRSVPASPTMSPPMPFASFSHFGPAPLSRKSLMRHSSREGLPGAKPVPSSQPPAVPQKRSRPSDLSITLSACFSSLAGSSSYSCHRAAHSEPSILSPISPLLSPEERSYFAFSPSSSPPATMTSFHYSFEEPPHSAPVATPLQARPSMRSTVSVRTRQVNRSAALAALEGRVRKQRPRSRPSNFMSMSDDEDDLDLDENDAPVTSMPAPPALLEVLHEEEDVVVPSFAVKRLSSPPSSKKSRSRRGTLESLLTPLANFIDFRDDDVSRSWPNFVSIS
ncbi:hypothetical protein K466DRAFT_605543 [Polyporus arcularius HHB13444]|uniref:Uncharacterized protein n=1 Tax=Polyporus arcularius HHB13444 TaxID=1314778 RepID=A0A5C3P360_9APHY|nr:hypothetical protein K466DRAFT_605543 [Polyporus arcularius HHB13444]